MTSPALSDSSILLTQAQRLARGLREFAEMLEHNPGMPTPAPYLFVYGASPAQLLEIARAAGAKSTEKKYEGETFTLVKKFSGDLEVHFSISREQVCRKVVTEVIEVPETVEPAHLVPERVIPAHTREVVEWECHPLLAPPQPGRISAGIEEVRK